MFRKTYTYTCVCVYVCVYICTHSISRIQSNCFCTAECHLISKGSVLFPSRDLAGLSSSKGHLYNQTSTWILLYHWLSVHECLALSRRSYPEPKIYSPSCIYTLFWCGVPHHQIPGIHPVFRNNLVFRNNHEKKYSLSLPKKIIAYSIQKQQTKNIHQVIHLQRMYQSLDYVRTPNLGSSQITCQQGVENAKQIPPHHTK